MRGRELAQDAEPDSKNQDGRVEGHVLIFSWENTKTPKSQLAVEQPSTGGWFPARRKRFGDIETRERRQPGKHGKKHLQPPEAGRSKEGF